MVIGDLIAIDLAEAKVSRFRMSEINPTHTRSGPHCKGLRNLHSCVGLDIKQTPENSLLRVIRASWVARCRSDSAVLLPNEIARTEAFVEPITPFVTHPLVQTFRESFREAVRNSLRH